MHKFSVDVRSPLSGHNITLLTKNLEDISIPPNYYAFIILVGVRLVCIYDQA